MDGEKKNLLNEKLSVFVKKIRAKEYDELYGCLSEAQINTLEKLNGANCKSMTATTLLTVFLGGWSAGRFYLGDYFFAVMRIVILFAMNIASVTLSFIPIFGSFLSAIVYIVIFAWYFAEIFNCRKLCSEKNLKIIKANVNADIAKSNLIKSCQKIYPKGDEIAEAQKKIMQKKLALAKKRLNERYWELLKPQLSGCGEDVLTDLDGLQYKKKTPALLLSIFLGAFGGGRFYLGDYVKAAMKLVCTVAMTILVVLALPIETLNILAINAYVITIHFFIFEEIFTCREICCKRNFLTMTNCITVAKSNYESNNSIILSRQAA